MWPHPKLAGGSRARGSGGSRGPQGLAAVPGHPPRLPGYPAGKAGKTRGPGSARSWETAAPVTGTVTATVTPADGRPASLVGLSRGQASPRGRRPEGGRRRGGRLVAALIASDRPRSTDQAPVYPRCLISINSSSKELAGDAAPPPSPPSPRLPSGLSGTKDL